MEGQKQLRKFLQLKAFSSLKAASILCCCIGGRRLSLS